MTEMLGEVLPLDGVVVVTGPPAIIVASVLALAGATMVMPYVIVRRLAGRWAGRARTAMRPVALEALRAVA